ncbi:hypothetical protein CsSME_00053762 [Camellia sinensis var. sinensis]
MVRVIMDLSLGQVPKHPCLNSNTALWFLLLLLLLLLSSRALQLHNLL